MPRLKCQFHTEYHVDSQPECENSLSYAILIKIHTRWWARLGPHAEDQRLTVACYRRPTLLWPQVLLNCRHCLYSQAIRIKYEHGTPFNLSLPELFFSFLGLWGCNSRILTVGMELTCNGGSCGGIILNIFACMNLDCNRVRIRILSIQGKFRKMSMTTSI